MRQLMKSRGCRSVCYALILTFLTTLVPTSFVKPASAQLMPTYSVGVVDFANESGVQGELLARLATDAVVVELSKTNRYDVSITRSMLKAEMEKLDLRPPLDKLGLVRLGESLQADAMLEGSVKSVQLAGSGATRRASVTLVVQMVDQASGEIVNGAVQTGTSSARVGYTPDDDSLISEAINNAAFLVVKTMVDYIIPEATVQMNIGDNQVMLNKGARDGLKPGMRMIVLRQKEIIAYIELRTVSATDADAKVTKSMRGIQPEDKVRAIFEMPMVSGSAKSQPLPSGAPGGSRGSKGSLSKIGKFVIGAAVVFGLVSLFRGGRGNVSDPGISSMASPDGIPRIAWDPSQLNHGRDVDEVQIIREDTGGKPVAVAVGSVAWDLGSLRLEGLYGVSAANPVTYATLASNPSSTPPISANWTPLAEDFGTQHTYRLLAVYKELKSVGTDESMTYQYRTTTISSPIRATAIEPVGTDPSDIISPDPDSEIPVSDLRLGRVDFRWAAKRGANIYKLVVEPVVPGTGRRWESPIIYATGDTVSLPADQRSALANWLATTTTEGVTMRWRIYCMRQGDDGRNPNDIRTYVKDWSELNGLDRTFIIGPIPPPL